MRPSRISLLVLLSWLLASCVATGPLERVYIPPTETPVIKLLKAMGDASRAGNFAEAEKQALAAMALSRPGNLGNKFYGIPFGYLATFYLRQRKYSEANALYRQAITYLATLGPFDERASAAIFSISSLGVSFEYAGRSDEAEDIYRRVLEYKKNVLGPVHMEVSYSLNNLGGVHERKGRYGEAERFYKQALAIKVDLLGAEHRDLDRTLYRLTRLSRKQGRNGDADKFQAWALAIIEKEEKNNPFARHGLAEAARLTDAAANIRKTGRFIEAEFQLIRALKIREKLLGSEHLDVIRSRSDLASIYKAQGLFKKSEQEYLRAEKIAERAFGTNHPVFALLLDNRATLYLTQNRNAEAEPLIKRSLKIFERVRGPEHLDVAIALNNLGWLYRIQMKYAEAGAASKRSLAIFEKLYGSNHPAVGNGLGNLAMILVAQGKNSSAERTFKRALAILGKPRVDETVLAVNRHNLAQLYIDLGRYAEAEPLLVAALTTLERSLDPSHPFVAGSLTEYARLLRATGRETEAEEIDSRLKAILAQPGD